MNTRKYIAFISYRHKPLDSAIARELHSLIEQYRVPRSLRKNGQKRLGLVFRDLEELPISSNLSQSIHEALDHSDYLIVVCTPETKESPWVRAEVDYFLQHHDPHHLLAVLADGEPQTAFLPSMLRLTHEDGTVESIEPLAVDCRAGSIRESVRKLRQDKLRLMAALIDCPYDALAAREMHRKVRRITSAAAVVISIALAFSALLLHNNRQISNMNGLLSERNAELQKQKAETQLRESELLTANAQEALDRGDRAAAIRYAVEALPQDKSDDRPYYVLAEKTLMDAMNVFNPDASAYLITDTALEQTTAVADFQLSGDGSRAVTIDGYGMVYCYDTFTGKALWANHIAAADETVKNRLENTRVFYIDDTQAVIGAYRGSLTAYSAETGSLLWSTNQNIENEQAIFLSPDQSMLAFVTTTSSNLFRLQESRFDLVFLSTATGEPLDTMTLLDGVNYFDYAFYSEFGRKTGAFSEDSRYFVGMYTDRHDWEDGNDDRTLVYYIANLEQKSLLKIEEAGYEYPITELIAQSWNSLFVSFAKTPRSASAATIRGYDLKTGELIWETTTPEISDNYFVLAENQGVTMLKSRALSFGKKDRFYRLDVWTGEIVAEHVLPNEVVCLHPMNASFFGMIYANGSYNAAWPSNLGISTSSAFSLGPVSRVEITGAGWLEGHAEDGYVTGFSYGSEADGYGCLAVLPAEGSNQVIVKRVAHAREDLTQETLLSRETERFYLDTISTDAAVLPGADGLLYARLDFDSPTGSLSFNPTIIAIDPQSHQVEVISEYHSVSLSDHWLLPDVSGYLVAPSVGNHITLHRLSDSSETTMLEAASVVMSESDNLRLIAYDSAYAIARRPSDRALMTVQCDGANLLLWENDVARQTVAVPDTIRWQLPTQTAYQRFLSIGGNGYVILSHYGADAASDAFHSFVLYDAQSDSWSMIEDQAHGNSGRLIRLGDALPLFAVIDSDQTLRVYDVASGSVTWEIPLNIPINSVAQLRFLLDDSLIMLLMSDGQFFLYYVEDGSLVYTGKVSSGSAREIVGAWRDADNQRLYLSFRAANVGFCIDERAWGLLAELNAMLCYVPETNEVYLFTTSSGLVAIRVPSTSELVEASKRLTQP